MNTAGIPGEVTLPLAWGEEEKAIFQPPSLKIFRLFSVSWLKLELTDMIPPDADLSWQPV